MTHKTVENINVDVATAGTEITFSASSGTDDATHKYYDMESFASPRKIVIACDQALELLEVDGVVLKNAKQIPTTGAKLDTTQTVKVLNSIKLRTTTATTHIEVMMM
jgi:hypothetical protein